MEFHLHFALEHPPEHVQIQRWEECLDSDKIGESELITLVERWPMHASEIDFMVRQAAVLAVIRGGVLYMLGRERIRHRRTASG